MRIEATYIGREGNVLDRALLHINLSFLKSPLEVWLKRAYKVIEKLVTEGIQQVHGDMSPTWKAKRVTCPETQTPLIVRLDAPKPTAFYWTVLRISQWGT